MSDTRKLNAVIRTEVLDEVDRIAKSENRTRSQMSDILLGEAVAARLKERGNRLAGKDETS